MCLFQVFLFRSTCNHFILFYFPWWWNTICCSFLFLLECLFSTCVSRQSHHMSDKTWTKLDWFWKVHIIFQWWNGNNFQGLHDIHSTNRSEEEKFQRKADTIVSTSHYCFCHVVPLLLSVSAQLKRPLQIHHDGGSACMCSLCGCWRIKETEKQTTATETCKLPSLFFVMQHLLDSAGLLSLRVHMGCDINHIHFSAAASKHFAL